MGLLRVPALWKWQWEAAPDQVSGPGFSLLLPTKTVSGGNGRFVALEGQIQHFISMILQLQRQRSASADYKVPHTWIWGTLPYKSAWGLSMGVAWGKEHLLACCLQCTTHTHGEMWGLLYCSHHLHCQGTSAQTVIQNQKCHWYIQKCDLSPGEMLGVIRWLPCWQAVTDQGALLAAGTSTSLLGPGRIFYGMLISNVVFPCVLVQVPLHQPGGTLGDPGLCHTMWAGPLLHLQGLWPMDGQPGVSTWSGRASQILGKGGGRVSFLCSHNNQTKVVQESEVWK